MPAVEQLPGPTAFGKYTLLARLATGGMGEVFLARSTADAGFQKLLVIKRLLPHLTDHPQFVNMFLDEARLAAQLHHPNICQIYELGKVGPDHYMAMEYVEGIQLATLLRGRSRSPKLSDPRLTCALLSQACEALHYAHNLRMPDGSLAAVVHRDVNPKNIMVTSAGTVKVLDFGVAKARGKLNLSRTGTLKGTYSYMSPEQLRGEGLDRRSDVFSLGIIAWESVTGRRLFKRPTDVEVWRAIAEKPIPRASALADAVSEELDGTIAKGLSRDRESRFSTAREFALGLEESLSSYGAPLSTVAIASEIERCFAKELEELRTVVMRAQRSGLDDDDDDFDGPTRLFGDDNLKERIAELAAGRTSSERKAINVDDLDTNPTDNPEAPSRDRARSTTGDTQVERPFAAMSRESVQRRSGQHRAQGSGSNSVLSRSGQQRALHAPSPQPARQQRLSGSHPVAQPPQQRTHDIAQNNDQTLMGHQPYRARDSAPTPMNMPYGQNGPSSHPHLAPVGLGPPPMRPVQVSPTFDTSISPSRRWPVIFLTIIIGLALAVGVHWVMTRGDEAPVESPVNVDVE